ncbi:zinc-binding protein A33-like [Oryzias melastigma]|uniref:zinc-binding protein A33-like n=1 Tax=Oryzias melastigma TaxID=30732 RepID=UPI00168CD2F3|nr:zinc-binding protein A33-like [Oryzias melastigma]
MASAGGVLSKEQLLCPICLDVFRLPVSTPCGHNFCRDCIQRYWQSLHLTQCPVCKHRFYMAPDLKVNTFISEVASHFTENECEIDVVDQAAGEVSCDVCIGKRVKAFRSCLDCLASFCETHLEPHHVVSMLKKHSLISPTMRMQERICKKHEKLLDWFCTTDQSFVCHVCTKTDHRGHHIVRIEDESRHRRAQIVKMNVRVQEMISCRRQTVFEINQAVDLSKRNTESEIEESLQIFQKLIQILLKSQAEVVEAMKTKHGQVQSNAAETTTELEREVERLNTRKDELELLSRTEDDLHLLQKFPDFSTIPAVRQWDDLCVESAEYVGAVRRALRRAASELEEAVKAEVKRLCAAECERGRRFAVDVTLDSESAHPKLVISENKKEVYHGDVAVRHPADPQRFYPCVSVLGKEGFSSGRFYFEVQVKGKTEWDVGVALESVQRKGGNWMNPDRGYWTLGMREEGKYWALSSPPVCVPLVDPPQRVGVYVDVGWGQVSFYNPDSLTHIYSFTGYSFSGRLLPHLNPHRNHSGVNSAPLIILPVNM